MLDYKQNLEQIAQVDLAQLSESYQREQEALARLEKARDEVVRQLLAYEGESQLDLELIQRTHSFLGSVRVRVTEQLAVVDDWASQVEAKRQELVKVMQEKKVLEKLKERYLAELEEAARLKETRLSDEIGTTLHHLSSRESVDTDSSATDSKVTERSAIRSRAKECGEKESSAAEHE